jgi:hypothetical protein
LKVVASFVALGAWYHGLRPLKLPMKIGLDDHGRFDVCEQPLPDGAIDVVTGERPRRLLIVAEREVEPARLELVDDVFTDPAALGNSAKALDTSSNDLDRLLEGVRFIVGSISFATGAALETTTAFGGEFQNEFIPESTEDRQRLAELGTRRARMPLAPTTAVETFADTRADETFITALASRQIASVYSDALGDLSPSARFFSLWRTLEFAFQAKSKDLTRLLLDYPQVMAMEFDRPELEDLRALRGRLGHAVSSNGFGEVLAANTMAIHHLGRLWSLVDWIVLSKPGPAPDARCDPLAELCAFIDRDGRVRMVGGGSPHPREWLESWSEMSPRFRN